MVDVTNRLTPSLPLKAYLLLRIKDFLGISHLGPSSQNG